MKLPLPRSAIAPVVLALVAAAAPGALADHHEPDPGPAGSPPGSCPSGYPWGVYVQGQYNLCCRQPRDLKAWLFAVLSEDWVAGNCIWV